jgi:predicted nucleic acid-binding protein
MDRLVIDASVAIKWFVTEPFSNQARQVLTAYEEGHVVLHAPDILISEFANTIWKKQLFQGLTAPDAKEILAAFRKLEFTLTSGLSLVEDAYQLAITNRRSFYDSLYLALSIRQNCNLVTADERLVNAVSASHSQVVWIPNWSGYRRTL